MSSLICLLVVLAVGGGMRGESVAPSSVSISLQSEAECSVTEKEKTSSEKINES